MIRELTISPSPLLQNANFSRLVRIKKVKKKKQMLKQ